MIALEVSVNGRKVALAGAEDLVVLNAIINAVGKLGSNARGTKHKRRGQDLFLNLGGLTGRMHGAADEHLRWIRGAHHPLAIGDEVRVRIVRTKTADKPKARRAAADSENAGRARFEWAKKLYLAEREKYEPSPAPRAREGASPVGSGGGARGSSRRALAEVKKPAKKLR